MIVCASASAFAQQVYNVRSAPYNATGGGTVDDTAAIQSAINAANSTGGVVYFPPGTYKYTSLSCTGATTTVSFRGDGQSSVLAKSTASGNGLTISGITTNAGYALRPGACVENLRFTYTAAPAVSTWALFLQSTAHSTVRDVRIEGADGAIYLDSNFDTHIVDTSAYATVHTGIRVGGTTDGNGTTIPARVQIETYLSNVLIEDGFTGAGAARTTQTGLEIDDWTSGFYATNCSFAQGYNGVLVNDAGGTTIWIPQYLFFTHCLCDGNYNQGWFIGNCKVLKLTSCWAATCTTGNGIDLTSGTDIRLVNCTVINNHSHGLYLQGSAEVMVDGGVYGSNGGGAANTYDGIHVVANLGDFSIMNVRAGNQNVWTGNPAAPNVQRYGVYIETGNSDRFNVEGCRLTQNGQAHGLFNGAPTAPNSAVSGNVGQ